MCRNSIDGILIQYGSDKKCRVEFGTRTCYDTGLVPTHKLTKPRAPLLKSLCCVIIEYISHYTVGYTSSSILLILTFPESNLSNLKKVTTVGRSSGLLSPLYHLTSVLTSSETVLSTLSKYKNNTVENIKTVDTPIYWIIYEKGPRGGSG